jgi:hypothetical protein
MARKILDVSPPTTGMSFRCTVELSQDLRRYAIARGVTITDAINECLAAGLKTSEARRVEA